MEILESSIKSLIQQFNAGCQKKSKLSGKKRNISSMSAENMKNPAKNTKPMIQQLDVEFRRTPTNSDELKA